MYAFFNTTPLHSTPLRLSELTDGSEADDDMSPQRSPRQAKRAQRHYHHHQKAARNIVAAERRLSGSEHDANDGDIFDHVDVSALYPFDPTTNATLTTTNATAATNAAAEANATAAANAVAATNAATNATTTKSSDDAAESNDAAEPYPIC